MEFGGGFSGEYGGNHDWGHRGRSYGRCGDYDPGHGHGHGSGHRPSGQRKETREERAARKEQEAHEANIAYEETRRRKKEQARLYGRGGDGQYASGFGRSNSLPLRSTTNYISTAGRGSSNNGGSSKPVGSSNYGRNSDKRAREKFLKGI